MSNHDNPTALRIGMSGVLNGCRYRVAGRVVLSMEQGGETYYWNEFHLIDDSGQSATLVFEETENGPEWKLFMLFDPVHPLTAAEAARKKVGDVVNLEGAPVPISLVDQSRVCYIEGTAPEGVDAGDIADYFNADDGWRMLVASWTGDEIEFYRGMVLPPGHVAAAFKLPASESEPGPASGAYVSEPGASSGLIVKIIPAVLTALIGFAAYSQWQTTHQRRAPAKPITRAAPLVTGSSGNLSSISWAVAGHAVVQIAKQGAVYDCHEYHLRDDAGKSALLVCGLTGNPTDWHLLRSASSVPALTPVQAAARRAGALVTLDGRALVIRDLFQAQVLSRDGELPAGVASENVAFGFIARSPADLALVRWTATAIEFYVGTALQEKEAISSFRR